MNPDTPEVSSDSIEKRRVSHSKSVLRYYHKRMAADVDYARILREKATARYPARRAADEEQGIIRKKGRPRTVIV